MRFPERYQRIGAKARSGGCVETTRGVRNQDGEWCAMRRLFASAAVVGCAVSTLLAPDAFAKSGNQDPALSEPEAALAAAVDCVGDLDPKGQFVAERDPVVFVHGTFTEGHEQYAWNYELRMQAENRPYCVVTYPDRGQGDFQRSAEYIVHAVGVARQMSQTGKVDMVGHSQGASMPRWAVKYFPSVQQALDDFVMHAGPAHGTQVAGGPSALVPLLGGQPAAYWQFSPDSEFTRHVNLGDESPGDVDYTSIYARTDELVQPSYGPNATAIVEGAWNIDVQEVCPARVVDHLSIGTTDAWVMELTLRILDDDPKKAENGAHAFEIGSLDCSIPNQYVTPATFGGFQNAGGGPSWTDFQGSFEPVSEEPPIRDYAIEHDRSREKQKR